MVGWQIQAHVALSAIAEPSVTDEEKTWDLTAYIQAAEKSTF